MPGINGLGRDGSQRQRATTVKAQGDLGVGRPALTAGGPRSATPGDVTPPYPPMPPAGQGNGRARVATLWAQGHRRRKRPTCSPDPLTGNEIATIRRALRQLPSSSRSAAVVVAMVARAARLADSRRRLAQEGERPALPPLIRSLPYRWRIVARQALADGQPPPCTEGGRLVRRWLVRRIGRAVATRVLAMALAKAGPIRAPKAGMPPSPR
jgi:hypothetical protein